MPPFLFGKQGKIYYNKKTEVCAVKKIKKQTETAGPTAHEMFFFALAAANVVLAAVRLILMARDIFGGEEE